MNSNRMSLLLPYDTYLVSSKPKYVTHMQIKNNDIKKCYELRFFNRDKVIAKSDYKNMTINVISSNDDKFSLLINEDKDKNQMELIIDSKIDVSTIKKYVDTLLI